MVLLYMCPHATNMVLLYMCPHATNIALANAMCAAFDADTYLPAIRP
jgi:hypothetical protein